MKRRTFFQRGSLAAAGLVLGNHKKSFALGSGSTYSGKPAPVVVSTWDFGAAANARAWDVLQDGGSSLDAVEMGIRVIEADPSNHSVGYGGYPDRDGHVTLDACIMNASGKAGSVAFLEGIMHPISLARKVMELTPHVMLAGSGALQFALENGFEKTDLLTPESRAAWDEWKKNEHYQPVINIENHDTIGQLCLDSEGDLAGGCSTSGLAYKIHGRVGDSPIIGAALFVDNSVGAAVTTGLGELVMRSLGSFLAVELMRHGASAQEACEEAVSRIIRHNTGSMDAQVGIVVLDKYGNVGAFSIHPGFTYAVKSVSGESVINSSSYYQ